MLLEATDRLRKREDVEEVWENIAIVGEEQIMSVSEVRRGRPIITTATYTK